MDVDVVTDAHTVSGIHEPLLEAGFRVERILEFGASDPDDYDRDLWEFPPDLMSDLPPTPIVAAKPP